MEDFKNGDRVKIVQNLNPFESLQSFGLKIGSVGTVCAIYEFDPYPILVAFDGRESKLRCKREEIEFANQLEVEIL